MQVSVILGIGSVCSKGGRFCGGEKGQRQSGAGWDAGKDRIEDEETGEDLLEVVGL